ncbi:sentrin-specific protease 8-like isoform X2 [Fopius arisanus]|nr:PREDICTED: sentrin-specific protease 8-like isoform X2 [Fopius arisanus]
MMSSQQDIVLSYHDVLIRRSDLKTLEDHSWLNDIIIGFYFDHLEREKAQEFTGKIVLASPELTQLLKLMEIQDYPGILDSRITEKTDFVFFPVNNCDDREDPGGAHWSLLVYSRSEASCFHFDSSTGFNRTISQQFSRKIMKFMNGGRGKGFVEVRCPQQGNSYDCGIFVLCFAERILEILKASGRVDGCDLRGIETEANGMREKILELIRHLSADGEK